MTGQPAFTYAPLPVDARDPILRAEKIGHAYGKQTVLSGIRISLIPGKVYGIAGPNGSGKSTLLQILAGYLNPGAGNVTLNGMPLLSLPPMDRARRIGWVPQQAVIGFPFTVFDLVMMGRHPHIPRFRKPSADDTDRVKSAIDQMDLTRFSGHPVTCLSGGERQRVLIARTMAQDPDIYMLDEVCTGLDIAHRLRLFDLLKQKTADHDRTVVMVLHDMNQIMNVCDVLFILDQGRLVASGPPETVLTGPRIREVFHVEAAKHRADGHGPFLTFSAPDRSRTQPSGI